ncbi:MAG: polysaccharide biosynthesis/export family protein [Deltaproteobacteria bacterium]|nr:polysaccharide biosynthesis/export family protein [Deltaproteobacteria bacterium]
MEKDNLTKTLVQHVFPVFLWLLIIILHVPVSYSQDAVKRPGVTKVYPAENSAEISKNTLIYAKFDRKMKKSYFNIFTVTLRDEKGNSIFGKIKYVSDKFTVYFIPRQELMSGTSYTITLKGQIEDEKGVKIGEDFSWSFTVGTKTQEETLTVQTAKEVSVKSEIADAVTGKTSSYQNDDYISNLKNAVTDAVTDAVNDKVSFSRNNDHIRNLKNEVKKVIANENEMDSLFLKKLNKFRDEVNRKKANQRKIAIDDLLNIRVFNSLGFEEINQDVAVYSDGFITFPMIGSVRVEGKTSKELINELTGSFEKEYFNNPRVEIRFKGIAAALETIKVYMLGQVKSPGLKTLPLGTRVLDALVSVSGTTESADLSNATIIRDDEELKIDLKKLVYYGEKIYDVPLKNEDTIFIPEKNKKKQVVYVLGKVRYPARYNFETGMTAVDALSMAEAFSQDFNDVQIIRSQKKDQQIIKIDMYKMMRQGDTDQDVRLMPGDIVYVLNTKRISRDEYIYIFSGDLAVGENSFQGRYDYESGMTLVDAVAILKGVPNTLKWVSIVRPEQEPVFVDLRRVLQNGRLDSDVNLNPGDILYFSPIRYRNIVKRFGDFLQRTVVPSLTTLHAVWDARKF